MPRSSRTSGTSTYLMQTIRSAPSSIGRPRGHILTMCMSFNPAELKNAALWRFETICASTLKRHARTKISSVGLRHSTVPAISPPARHTRRQRRSLSAPLPNVRLRKGIRVASYPPVPQCVSGAEAADRRSILALGGVGMRNDLKKEKFPRKETGASHSSARHKDHFSGELTKQHHGIFAGEQSFGEFHPSKRGRHRNPETYRAVGGVPGEVRCARGDYHYLSCTRRPFLASNPECSLPLEYLEALLHLWVCVLDDSRPRASPGTVHHEYFRSANLEFDLFARTCVLNHGFTPSLGMRHLGAGRALPR